jgi:subtilase family serine protease
MVSDWTLSAILPTEPAYTYASAPQQALYAGEKAEMLLTFDKTKSGIQDIKITVDPDNKIIESLETNNSAELKMVN